MYKKVSMYFLPTFSFYLIQTPFILVNVVYRTIRKKSIHTYMEQKRIINELRLQAFNYSEKDTQMRKTFLCAYKKRGGALAVRYRFHKKADETMYAKFKESIDLHSAYPSSEISYKKGWAYFNIYMTIEPRYEYKASDTYVSIGTNDRGLKKWDFAQYPHMLVAGETGQGKSVFVRYVLNGLFSAHHEVWCVDGKCVDYALTKDVFEKYVAYEKGSYDNIVKLLSEFVDVIHERYNKMSKKGILNYCEDDEINPLFFLFDEYLFIVSTMKTKEDKLKLEKLERLISDAILLGRACGCFLILTMQRADAKFIGGVIRDNFLCRIVLGKASKISYQMMFEDTTIRKLEIGNAWCQIGTDFDMIAIPYYNGIEIKKEDMKELNALVGKEEIEVIENGSNEFIPSGKKE